MQFSMRKFVGTSVMAAMLVVTSFGGRPIIEAQQPLAGVQTGDLADLLAAPTEAASVDYFLKLEGVDGESTDDCHKGEIEILSWSWGATNAGAGAAGGGGGAGKVSMQDFHFTASSSKASPQLFLSAATGKHHKEAVPVVRKSGGKDQVDYYKITLSDVLISSYQASTVGRVRRSPPATTSRPTSAANSGPLALTGGKGSGTEMVVGRRGEPCVRPQGIKSSKPFGVSGMIIGVA